MKLGNAEYSHTGTKQRNAKVNMFQWYNEL